MTTWNIDWATVINWLGSGLIGALFGILGGWASFRFAMKRDEINWKRELDEKNKQREIEQQYLSRQQIIQSLTKDINNPGVIKKLAAEFDQLHTGFIPNESNSLRNVQLIQLSLQFILEKLEQPLYANQNRNGEESNERT